jgi:GTP-binding protein
MVLADIPGLIEGAASGKGLGHEFLRHVERARVLVILLDPSPLQEQSPAEQLEILSREIAQYSSELAARPRVVLLNKADLGDMGELGVSLGAMPVSAMSGQGVREALHAIADLVDEAERVAPQRKGFVLHRPLGPSFTLRREEGAWRVEGIAAERAVGFADLTLPEAADMAAARLSRLGVDQALLEAGAVAGDEVRIGDISFEFTPERSFEEE